MKAMSAPSGLLHLVPGAALFALSGLFGSFLPTPLRNLALVLGFSCFLTGLILAATRSDKLTPAWYREQRP